MAKFVERNGKVFIETDKGAPLAYFDTDGTFVPIYGSVAVSDSATFAKSTGAKTITSPVPPHPEGGRK